MRSTFRFIVQWQFTLLLLFLPFKELRSAEMLRLEQRISDFLPQEKIGSVMEADGDWAALSAELGPSPYRGKVLMCRRQSGTWSTTQTLEPPDAGPHQYFGQFMSLQGDWLAVTELGENTLLNAGKTTIMGVVRMFHREGDRWSLVQTLRAGAEITEGGFFQYGTAVELHGDRLIVLFAGQEEPTERTGMEYLPSSLHSFRLHGGSWQLEQVITGDAMKRPSVYGVPSLSLKDDWLAVGDRGRLSKEWQPSGAVHLYRLQNGSWKLSQTLLPPEALPIYYFGAQTGFTDHAHLLITTNLGVMESRWNGKQWTPPVILDIAQSLSTYSYYSPSLAVNGTTAAVKQGGTLRLLTLTDQGWQRLRDLSVIARVSNLALSQDTVLFLSDFPPEGYDWRAVSFLSLTDIEVRLGRVQVQTQNSRQLREPPAIASGSEVIWQPQLEGNEMPLVVKNASPGLMSRPVAKISGAMAASFEILPQPASQALLVPIEQMTFILRPRTGMLVTDVPLTVTFSHAGAVPDYTFQVRWKLPSGPLQGSPLVSLLQGDFWSLGQSVHLAPAITGMPVMHTPTYQWLRDGVVLADQNKAVLSIPEVKPEHAGKYILEVRHQSGTTRSNPCQVVVFESVDQKLNLRDGEMGSLKPRFWGSASIVWQNPESYQALMTSPYLAGITLPTLTILDGRWISDSGITELHAFATIIDPISQWQMVSGVIGRFQLISAGRKPTLTPIHSSVYAVGDSISESVVFPIQARDNYGGRNAWPGSRVTASGLPPGIQLRSQNELEGTFTKAGIYPVTWRLQDASGAWSDPVVSEFIVGQSSIAGEAGLYVGTISGNGAVPDLDFQGCLEVRMELSGSFSGTLKMPGATRRFAGKFKKNEQSLGDFAASLPMAALPGTQSARMNLFCAPNETSLTVDLQCVVNEGTEEVFRSSLRHRPRRPRPLPIEKTGAYNVLSDNSGALDARDSPSGTGLMRVTVSSAYTAQVVGTLADGTGYTSACQLIPDDYGMMTLVFFHEDRAQGNLLGGEILIGIHERPLFIQGALRWKKQPSLAAKLYPAGFDANLRLEGWRYIPPPNGMLLLSESPDRPGNAVCQTDFMDDGLFRLTRDHRAIPISTRAASKLQRLDFYAPTGFFTGQIRAGGSTSESGSRIPASSVPFRGLILPPSSYGGGFYLFPKSANDISKEPSSTGRTLHSHQVRLFSK